MGTEDFFSTDIEGLPAAADPVVVRLRDGDTHQVRLHSVRKQIGPDELRMLAYNGSIPGPTLHVDEGSEITVEVVNDTDMETTVHWHGLRLENRYDGVPHETQEPIPIGGTYTHKLQFPDAGFYWYHPHIREDYAQEMGLYGPIVVEPSDPDYWPPADRFLTLTLDDLLVEDGHIAAFHKSGPTFVAMGRFGNVLLVNGNTEFAADVTAGEVVRLYLVNTTNTRIFNVAIADARMKLVGGDSGRVEREEFVEEVLLAPSERAVVDVHFDRPGVATLQHRTPDTTYELGGFAVSEGRQTVESVIRRAPRGSRTGHGAGADSGRPGPSAGQDPGLLRRDAIALWRRRGGCGGGLRVSDAPGGHQRRAGHVPEVRDEADSRSTSLLRVSDAPGGHQRRTGDLSDSAG